MYDVKKIGGFTLLEMIIVLAIVSILFLAIRSGFQHTSTHNIQAQACLQHSYGQIQSRLYAGLTQRSIQNNPPIFPEMYHITLHPHTQNIILGYNNEDFTIIQLDQSQNIGCHNSRYKVIMTGNQTNITIQNKIMRTDAFTGTTDFLVCQEGECKPLGSIYYDTRSQQMRLYLCPQQINDFCSPLS